jgi:heparan-alpha-glucosaminide N-acetyltransferase
MKLERLASLDAFRGLDILVMTFVNYIAGMAAVPFILRHAPADMDAFTLTDVVFPGFLFIVGVAIPLSLHTRIARGDSPGQILERILVRTAALLFLGLIMANEGLYSPKETGFSKGLWYFLAYLAVIALWTSYPKAEKRRRKSVYLGLRIAAGVLLAFLVVVFRARGDDGSVTWLQIPWWGILGIIGWCYLTGCVVYLISKGRPAALMGAMGLMIALYIGSRHGVLDFLASVNRVLDIGRDLGSHSAIVVAGILVGTLFTSGTGIKKPRERIVSMGVFGTGLCLAGYLLRPLHGFSKIHGTESYALVTSGICCLLFLLTYVLMDVFKIRRWAQFLQPVGRNPLMAYILPSIVDSILSFASTIFKLNIKQLFWPFWEKGGLSGMLNALALTGLILLITWALTRAKVILKL